MTDYRREQNLNPPPSRSQGAHLPRGSGSKTQSLEPVNLRKQDSILETKTIKHALRAAENPILIQSRSELKSAAAAWSDSECLGLDTEFVRERTYFAHLGLIQVSDGCSVWLVDPLSVPDLDDIVKTLENPAITKVFHAPSEDLEVLSNTLQSLPSPMVDTQLACALLGQPLQMGYHATAEWLLNVPVAKDLTRSNWIARPLPFAQLRYAALDVCLLPLMWTMLDERLKILGRETWMVEDCARQLTKASAPTDLDQLWLRFRGIGRLDGQQLAILKSLAIWRDEEARIRNLPRGFVVPDAVLMQIATDRVHETEDLKNISGMHSKALERLGTRICQLVRKIIKSGAEIEPVPPLTAQERGELAVLRAKVKDLSGELELDPAVLATKRELEMLVRSGPLCQIPPRLSGWREQVMTRKLLNIMGH